MQRKFFSSVQAHLPLENKKEIETLSQSPANQPPLNLNAAQATELLSCHQDFSRWEKNVGVCLFNQEQFGFFACAESKEKMEKQKSTCNDLFQKIKSGR